MILSDSLRLAILGAVVSHSRCRIAVLFQMRKRLCRDPSRVDEWNTLMRQTHLYEMWATMQAEKLMGAE